IRPRPNDVVLMVDREQAKDMGSARGRRTGRRPARPNAIDAVLEPCPGRIIDQRNLAPWVLGHSAAVIPRGDPIRSEEHTSELQSLMRLSYPVFCLKKKN